MRLPSEADRGRCALALDRLVACSGIRAGMLALRDGRPFLMKSRDTTIEPGRVSAMVSSTVALGHTFLRELGAAPLDHILIEGAHGKLVIVSIPASGGLLVLAVVAERNALLGLVLGHSKTCALAVADVFAGSASGARQAGVSA